MAQPPTIYKPGKLNYVWNYLGKTLKDFAQAPFEEWYINQDGQFVSSKWTNYQRIHPLIFSKSPT